MPPSQDKVCLLLDEKNPCLSACLRTVSVDDLILNLALHRRQRVLSHFPLLQSKSIPIPRMLLHVSIPKFGKMFLLVDELRWFLNCLRH